MKRTLSLLLICMLAFTACTSQKPQAEPTLPAEAFEASEAFEAVDAYSENDFSGLSDPELLRYIEDTVYTGLIGELDSDSYFIENVSARYVSKEYLEELAFNSQENIYFGYSLAELNQQFQGTRYIFTVGEEGQTIVKEFEAYDDTYEKVVKNVAIGTGVILICVTVSVVTGGLGLPAVSIIFAASAKSAAIFGVSGGVISGAAAGIVTGIQTNDFEESMKTAALAGSEGFKWGAIVGSIADGAGEAVALKGATLNGLSMSQAAQIQRQSKLPLSFIKNFKSVEEYNIYNKAGLVGKDIAGKPALWRPVDLDYMDETTGLTNAERIMARKSPHDEKGVAYELHHIGQKPDAPLAILTKEEHMQGGNNTILHNTGVANEGYDHGSDWARQVQRFWNDYLAQAQGG